MKRWHIEIQDDKGNLRTCSLDHEYENKEQAIREAEAIADVEYNNDDIAWSLNKCSENCKCDN